MIRSSGSVLLLLGCLPLAVVCLSCYTCVFPVISPLDCLKSPLECPEDQLCLSSVAIAGKGPLTIVLHEKGCAVKSQCGLTGEKHAAGLSFNYTTECCNTDLCNSSPCWTGEILTLIITTVSLLILI